MLLSVDDETPLIILHLYYAPPQSIRNIYGWEAETPRILLLTDHDMPDSYLFIPIPRNRS